MQKIAKKSQFSKNCQKSRLRFSGGTGVHIINPQIKKNIFFVHYGNKQTEQFKGSFTYYVIRKLLILDHHPPPLILTPISSLNFITCYHLRTPSPLTEVINMWIICKVKDNEYLCIILHILTKKIRASFRNNFYVIPQRLVFNTVVDTNNIFSKNVYFILKNITRQNFWMVS